jgi:hypothetical protein
MPDRAPPFIVNLCRGDVLVVDRMLKKSAPVKNTGGESYNFADNIAARADDPHAGS